MTSSRTLQQSPSQFCPLLFHDKHLSQYSHIINTLHGLESIFNGIYQSRILASFTWASICLLVWYSGPFFGTMTSWVRLETRLSEPTGRSDQLHASFIWSACHNLLGLLQTEPYITNGSNPNCESTCCWDGFHVLAGGSVKNGLYSIASMSLCLCPDASQSW